MGASGKKWPPCRFCIVECYLDFPIQTIIIITAYLNDQIPRTACLAASNRVFTPCYNTLLLYLAHYNAICFASTFSEVAWRRADPTCRRRVSFSFCLRMKKPAWPRITQACPHYLRLSVPIIRSTSNKYTSYRYFLPPSICSQRRAPTEFLERISLGNDHVTW